MPYRIGKRVIGQKRKFGKKNFKLSDITFSARNRENIKGAYRKMGVKCRSVPGHDKSSGYYYAIYTRKK